MSPSVLKSSYAQGDAEERAEKSGQHVGTAAPAVRSPQAPQVFSAISRSSAYSAVSLPIADPILTTINPYNPPMITVSKEDYLKSILEAETEGETVISARLAQLLRVSPPAVTMALRRLKKDGLVRVGTKGEISLTADGRKIARKLTLRHHLIERMLSELFGMEWWKVHDEAERLEHAVSPDFEAKLLAKLGSAGACPHGNLSEVESSASRRRRGLVLLADADIDTNYKVSGIYERDRGLLEFLEHRGIRPGSKLKIVERNYDQTLTLTTQEGTISLGPAASQRVWLSSATRPKH